MLFWGFWLIEYKCGKCLLIEPCLLDVSVQREDAASEEGTEATRQSRTERTSSRGSSGTHAAMSAQDRRSH